MKMMKISKLTWRTFSDLYLAGTDAFIGLSSMKKTIDGGPHLVMILSIGILGAGDHDFKKSTSHIQNLNV